MTYFSKTMTSDVGALTLVATPRGLAAILWENDRPGRVRLGPCTPAPEHEILRATEAQLRQYFAGALKTFSVPLDYAGTAFQKDVWAALTAIPFGETRSYGELARDLGRPNASRAVGAANGRNPISIIVPCHRVIGANGSLTGFAGGLAVKRQLLALESNAAARQLPLTGHALAAPVAASAQTHADGGLHGSAQRRTALTGM